MRTPLPGRLQQGDGLLRRPRGHGAQMAGEGGKRLHLVDLDGAAAGEVRNTQAIEDIVKNTSLAVELGGGIRRDDVVEQLIKLGVKRVILGTVAVEQIELTRRIIKRFGEAIVVGIDARDSYVTTHGWLKISTMTVLELSTMMAAIGARRIIYTDVKRDGTLTEPNYEATAELVRNLKIPVIASGGVSSMSISGSWRRWAWKASSSARRSIQAISTWRKPWRYPDPNSQVLNRSNYVEIR